MFQGVLSWLNNAIGVNHLDPISRETPFNALVRIAAGASKAVYNPENEAIHFAPIIFYIIKDFLQNRPNIFSSCECLSKNSPIWNNRHSSIRCKFSADTF